MSLTLLDRVLITAQYELEAMRIGDVETAQSYFEERSLLLDRAVETLDEGSPDDYRIKLIALQGYQEIIYEEASQLLENIRLGLQQTQKNRTAVKKYSNIGRN